LIEHGFSVNNKGLSKKTQTAPPQKWKSLIQ
jgi:hypothetical protein